VKRPDCLRSKWAIGTLAIGLTACNTPDLRGVVYEEDIVQGSSYGQSESASQDDTSPATESFTVTGSSASMNFHQNIQHASGGFTQVPVIGRQGSADFHQAHGNTNQITDVDILIMMDNSPSMQRENIEFSARISTLVHKLAPLNSWRVGVTSSDGSPLNNPNSWYGRLALNSYISNTNPPSEGAQSSALSSMIDSVRATVGSSTERPFFTTIGVMRENPQQFFRSNTHWAFIFVTDEDSCSRLSDEQSHPQHSNPAFNRNTGNIPFAFCHDDWDLPEGWRAEAIAHKNGDASKIKTYGVAWIPGTQEGFPSPEHNEAVLIQFLVNMFGGFMRDIWATQNYAQVLEDIGNDFNDGLTRRFTLPEVPNANSIRLTVNGVLWASNRYTLEGATIVFGSDAPPSDANIHVEYFVGTAPITTYTLPSAPIVSSLVVRFGGVQQNSGYSYDAGSRVMTFNPFPPANTVVNVAWDIQPPVQLNYDIGTPSDPPATNSVSVRKDNVALPSSAFHVTGTVVTLHADPGPYAQIDVTFTRQSTLSAEFPLAHTPMDGVTLSSNGSPFPFGSYMAAGNRIVLDRTRISPAQSISAGYNWRSRDTRAFTVSGPVMAGTLQVSVGGIVQPASAFTFSNNVVTFAASLPAKTSLTFNYIRDHVLPKAFVLNAQIASTVVEVYIDGKQVTDYSYDAKTKTLSFPTAPPARSQIAVYYN
jgi:hypothetical protein